MKYLRLYNESTTQLPSREELKELFTLNLEDNEHFDATRILVVDVTANSKGTRRQIIIDEDFRESRNPEIIDLLTKLNDNYTRYNALDRDRGDEKKLGYENYKILKQEFIKLILNITNKLVEKIGKKYGFEIQTIDFNQTSRNDFSGLDFPTERISIVIVPSLTSESLSKYNESQDEDILKFLYAVEEVDKELDAESDDHWSMQINADYDPNRDFIQVDYSSHGYSEGFSDSLRVYYKETPIRVERQNHGDTVFGEFDNQRTEEFNSLDDLIKDIKEEFGK
jgi:hypothetical protein